LFRKTIEEEDKEEIEELMPVLSKVSIEDYVKSTRAERDPR